MTWREARILRGERDRDVERAPSRPWIQVPLRRGRRPRRAAARVVIAEEGDQEDIVPHVELGTREIVDRDQGVDGEVRPDGGRRRSVVGDRELVISKIGLGRDLELPWDARSGNRRQERGAGQEDGDGEAERAGCQRDMSPLECDAAQRLDALLRRGEGRARRGVAHPGL